MLFLFSQFIAIFCILRGFAPGFVNYKKGGTRLPIASDKVYQLLAHGRWFSPGTPASSTTKTGRHDIAEILLKVALSTKNQSIIYLVDFINVVYGQNMTKWQTLLHNVWIHIAMSGIRTHTFCCDDRTAQNIQQTEENNMNTFLVINFDVFMYEQPMLLSLSIYSYFHK